MDRRKFLKVMLYAGAAMAVNSCMPFHRKVPNLFDTVPKIEYLKTGMLVTDTIAGYEQQGLVEKIGEYIDKHRLDIFLGPEWLFVPKQRLYTKEEKDSLVARLVETTKGKNTLSVPGTIMWYDDEFFYNATPVIANGKLLDEYKKQTDGGSASMAEEKLCPRSNYGIGKKPGLYNWRGYSIGVEICADHGMLKNFLDMEKKPYPDLYLLTSCGMTLGSYSTPIREGGYALHSDGYYEVSGVSKRVSKREGHLIDVNSIGKDKELHLYEILVYDSKEAPLSGLRQVRKEPNLDELLTAKC